MLLNAISEYHLAKQFKIPDAAPVMAGGAHKTSIVLLWLIKSSR